MNITDKNKEELFYDFSDGGSNEEITMSKDAFKKAIDKALNLYGVGNSLPSEKEMELKEIEEYNKANSIDKSVDRLDFGSGFYKCYKWIERFYLG
jgi:hypothetical protein